VKKTPKAKTPKVDPFVEGLMGKLLERLTLLERKMDTVISQTSSKGSGHNSGAPAAVNRPPQAPAPQAPKERQMYEAICANCSKVCEVPFRPSENRAVYCKVCFAQKKGQPHGMPILRPVSIPPKPAGKLGEPIAPPPPVAGASKKAKKSKPAKSAKKKR
jgi:CxxC-x17-CxxC domain-containing protein